MLADEAHFEYRLEPIVDLMTGDVMGHELLAGETSCPDWGIEQWRGWYGRLPDLVSAILAGVDKGQPIVAPLFVNVDGEQLLDPIIGEAFQTLEKHVGRVVIEWTEMGFHHERLVDVLAKLNFLRSRGFRLAVDDIGAGTGVDGLGRAGAVKAEFHKIDGAFFQRVRERGPEYLRGLCQHLAHGGAKVIVEWVETEEDYRLALAAGAHYGQGWFWRA